MWGGEIQGGLGALAQGEHTIAAAQQEELEREIESLKAEAERIGEEARELAGEVPF